MRQWSRITKHFGIASLPHCLIAPLFVAPFLVAPLLITTLSAQQTTFRSSVDLIAVDAIVIDRSGQPILSLGSDRFDVSINGSRRRVLSAEYVGGTGSGGVRAARPGSASAIATNVWPGGGDGLAIVLAVDSASFQADEWQRAIGAARMFLARLNGNDRVGLYAYPFGPILSVTADRGRVLNALRSTAGGSPTIRTAFHLTTAEIVDISAENARSTSPITAVRRTRTGALDVGDDAPTVQRVQDRECPTDANCSARILMDADNAAANLEARLAQGVAGLQSMLRAIALTPGRKIVVLLSGGMPVSDLPGGRPQADDLARSLGDQLAQASAAIYTLQLDATSSSAISAAQPRMSLGASDRVRQVLINGRWLEELSVASGGALLRVETDDGESALERVLRENAGYYLLGVEPGASDRDGRLRELKVKVRERGATVRHRRWVIVPTR